MSSISFVRLFLFILPCSLGLFVAAATIPSTTISSSPQASNVTIALSSAIQIEASVSLKLQQLASTAAIPLPTNVTQFPQFEAARQLAPVMPLIQEGIKWKASDMVADLISSSNISNTRASLTRRQSSMRVLIVGDSITQGQQGDWTWRYRIWQWFQQNSVSVQMVGPYKGTHSPPLAGPPSPPALYGAPADTSFTTDGGYARGIDSGFLSNSNHFAVWGRAAAVDKGLIQGVLQQNNADLMLLMLGFNDLGWFYSDTSGTLASIQSLITSARSVNPNLKIAVANIPHRTHINGRDDLVQSTDAYNNQLPGLLSQMSTTQSPLHVVDIAGNYACTDAACPAGYDGLHPNAWGEYQIASAFSKTLVNDFKIGSSPLTVPSQGAASLAKDLPVPSNIRAFSSPQGVTVTWDAVYGAYSYDVQATMNGIPASWSAGTVPTNRWDTQWPLEGWTYTVSVRASAGDSVKSPWTSSVSAVATPDLPPPPQNINVQPTGNGLTVTWDPPTGGSTGSIVEYNVLYWDWESSHCQYISGAAFKSSPAVINTLTPGRNYAIFLVTWNQNGQGLPVGSFSVVPGAGTPPVPSGLQVNTNDPTTVHLTWSGSDSAGGYRVWNRNVNVPGSEMKVIWNVTISPYTCNDQYYLFPGAWNYAFAVSSFNGDKNSERGPEVIAPSPASGVTQGSPGPTCPPNPAWCPAGGSISIPPVDGGTTTVIGGTTSTLTSTITTVVGGTTTVIDGTTTVIGGITSTQTAVITTINGGTTSVIGGSTTVIGGTTTVIDGTTTVLGGTTVVGGKTSVIGGTTTVVGGITLFPPGPITTVVGGTTSTIVIGGTTTVIDGRTTVIGGTTSTTVIGGTSTTLTPTSSGGVGPVITGLPTVTNGHCTGSDCVNGHCIGILCASFGCSGSGCVNGLCIGLDCIAFGCIGPNCSDGICKGLGCLNIGCLGSDCEGGGGGGGGTGHCFGLKCISLGCIGLDCGPGGTCHGPKCSIRSCSGSDCHNGVCAGPSCNPSGGEVGGGPDAPDDGKDQKQCTTSSKYATCTTRFMVVTSVFPDQDSTTTSTSTSSTCYTVTACTGSATTVSTTTSTATTIESFCDKTSGNCGSACTAARKPRDVHPTGAPLSKNSADSHNVTIAKRSLPPGGSGDWSDFYGPLMNSPDTFVLNNFDEMRIPDPVNGIITSNTAVKEIMFTTTRQNLVIRDLEGCIAIVAVSSLGAIIMHVWEVQTVQQYKQPNDNWQNDILETMQYYFDPTSPTHPTRYFTSKTEIFIMVPSDEKVTDGSAESIKTLKEPASQARYEEQVAKIQQALLLYLPNAFIRVWPYTRQIVNSIRSGDGAWGKLAVLYEPDQRTAPNGQTLAAGFAASRVYLQAYNSKEMYWPRQELTLWRVNDQNHASNVMVSDDGVLNFPDVCRGDIGKRTLTHENVDIGSQKTDCGPEQTFGQGGPGAPFDIKDSRGNVYYSGCKFVGKNYAPDASWGLLAGEITCADGDSWYCDRPENTLATTCGSQEAFNCGVLGKDCPNSYYQLLARCRF